MSTSATDKAQPESEAKEHKEEKEEENESGVNPKDPTKITKKFREQVDGMLSTGDMNPALKFDPAKLSYAAKSFLRRRCEKQMRKAHILMGQQFYDRARDGFLRAKVVLLTILGDEEDAISDADHSLGYICFQLSQGLARSGEENIRRGELMSTSITHLEDALEMRRRMDGATSRRTGLTLDLLSIVQLHSERLREAAMFAQQAQHVWQEVEGPGSLRLAAAQCTQGRAFLGLEEDSKAALVYKKAVETRKNVVEHFSKLKDTVVKGDISAGETPKIVTKNHKDFKKHKYLLAQTLYDHALALHNSARYDNANDQLERAFKIRASLTGFKPPTPDGAQVPKPHALLVDTQQLMGKCHLKKHDLLQASKHFRIALSMQLELLGAEDILSTKAVEPLAATLMHELGVALTSNEGREEGLPVLKRAAAIRGLLALPKLQALTLRALAKMFTLKADALQDALEELKIALSIQNDAYKKPHLEQANTMSSIGYTFCLMRHYKQALKQYQRALDVVGKTEGYRSKAYGEILLAMANMHVNLQEIANARSLGMQAKLTLQRACSSPKTADPILLRRVDEFIESLAAAQANLE